VSRKNRVITNRSVFERLIDLRLREAKLLMDQIQDWDGAYYLAGYAVECALKVRIIAQLSKLDYIPEKRYFEVGYSHSLNDLREVAGLEDLMKSDSVVNSQWDQISNWDEQSRPRDSRMLHGGA